MLSGGGDPLFDGSRGSSGSGGGGAGGVSESIRAGFGHINDLFSQFSKHISPSYHHERPERSVQMRLYVMHKGQYLLTTIMFLCLFFIALLMGMAGPRITTEHKEYATLLPKQPGQNESLAVGPYNILTPQLTVYRQQLWLAAEIKLGENDQQGTFAKPFKVTKYNNILLLPLFYTVHDSTQDWS